MALSSTDIVRSTFGNKRVAIVNVVFDSSYVTGGEALTASMVNMARIDSVVCLPHASRIATYAHSTGKVLLYTALGTEAANASDQSSITIQALVVGN